MTNTENINNDANQGVTFGQRARRVARASAEGAAYGATISAGVTTGVIVLAPLFGFSLEKSLETFVKIGPFAVGGMAVLGAAAYTFGQTVDEVADYFGVSKYIGSGRP